MKLLSALLLTAALCLPATLKLGGPFTLKESIAVGKVTAEPETYVGKTIQVKGKVTEVCQMIGCWMSLADADTGKLLRVKVNDGDMVFPKESVGKMAVAEGKLIKIELSREQAVEQAKHEAEEQGRKFNASSVKAGTTIYQLQGTGALIIK